MVHVQHSCDVFCYYTGWAKKPDCFLKVCNSRICQHIRELLTSKNSPVFWPTLYMSHAVASMCGAVRLFTFAIRPYLIPLTVKLSMYCCCYSGTCHAKLSIHDVGVWGLSRVVSKQCGSHIVSRKLSNWRQSTFGMLPYYPLTSTSNIVVMQLVNVLVMHMMCM